MLATKIPGGAGFVALHKLEEGTLSNFRQALRKTGGAERTGGRMLGANVGNFPEQPCFHGVASDLELHAAL